MKFFHISDLHIGKKLRETDFTNDQIYILDKIIELVDLEKPDGILIAGDIYDRSVPPVHAIGVFDEFLTKLSMRDLHIFIISGNHDSPDRLNFGREILGKHKVHIAGAFKGELSFVELEDEYGPLIVYMLPYIKPSIVANYMTKEPVTSYEMAAQLVIDGANIDQSKRNILLAHQFVTNNGMEPDRSDSENISVGGLDNIDVSVFDAFDYVALGHIHGPQKIGRDTVRYSGTPLKYSFSECNHKKSVTCVTLLEKEDTTIKQLPLTPLRDLRIIKDTLENLLTLEKYTSKNCEDYIQAILTDEEDIYDPMGKLRTRYPNILFLEIQNTKNRNVTTDIFLPQGNVGERGLLDLFEEFFINQNNIPLTKEQKDILISIYEDSKEEML